MILDILDYYELFKLSMMLCNRYKLTDRIGNYLLQLSLKYSNLSLFQNDWNGIAQTGAINKDILNCRFAQAALSHEVLHNVLAYIEPNYLELKPQGVELTEKNSLGMDTYRTLLHLGFWKKLVYLT